MIKTAAAQEIGTLGFALVSIVATTEDAAGYSRPVTFYDSQLMMVLSIEKQKQLATARSRAIQCGWLQYEHGRKGVPGYYFVTIPNYANQFDDSPSDEGHDGIGNENGTKTESKRNGRGTKRKRKGNENGTFLTCPYS